MTAGFVSGGRDWGIEAVEAHFDAKTSDFRLFCPESRPSRQITRFRPATVVVIGNFQITTGIGVP